MAIEDFNKTSVVIVPRDGVEEVTLKVGMPDKEEHFWGKIIITPELKGRICREIAKVRGKCVGDRYIVLLGYRYLKEKGLVQGGDLSYSIGKKLFEAWNAKVFLYRGKQIIVVGE